MLKPLKNQNGFSLVSAVIGSAVGVIAALAFASMMSKQYESMGFLQDQMSKFNLENELRNHFLTGDSCTETFQGVTVPTIATDPNNPGSKVTEVLAIKNQDNVVRWNFGEGANRTYVEYDSIKMINPRLVNVGIAAGADNGQVNLVMNIGRNRSGGGSASLKNIQLSMNMNIDPTTRAVTNCNIFGAPTDGEDGTPGGPNGPCSPTPDACRTAMAPAYRLSDNCNDTDEKEHGTIFNLVIGADEGCWGNETQIFTCVSGLWIPTGGSNTIECK